MMIYNSQARNTDPFPYIGEHGSRHAYAGTLNQKPLKFAPRPEYDNEPNPILAELREHLVAAGARNFEPVVNIRLKNLEWMRNEHDESWAKLTNETLNYLDHARKVLTRLAALGE